ncbi:hypothetical protein CMO96_00665 [Candidatus Woesebacteria bacterium]|nr:hypothetical protein [Candidatus Woesebacteria bacterium]
MDVSDPRFIYLLAALPIIFGITLVGDGISKIIHEKHKGWISLSFGIVFLLAVLLGLATLRQ